ncbi:MAG: serine/threonine protein kinase [Kiritimatiellae bacterium]|nr:serine/threonine protein kinase [Kiritimatiellia bacterium]
MGFMTTASVDCGEWRLGREIGRGAYGVVYVAANGKGERAAVKVCRRDNIGAERYGRELRGARLYRAIPQHEGLVRMRELGEDEWGFYTVMDLADDEFGRPLDSPEGYRPKTLASVIAGEKALPLKECVKLALSLANGLAALQRHHLLHRDIKPENVLYVGGRPVLSDPGLVIEESVAVSTVGTPVYLPPERKFTEPASDIYCLGLTLKAASFGRQVEDLDKGPAMEADTGAALFPAWWRILNKATDPTPSRRYQSAKALIKDLKRLRVKMAVARFAWMYKTAMGISFFAAIAYAYASYRERKQLEPEIKRVKQFFAIQQALNDCSSQDDAAWSSFSGSYHCRTDESHKQRLKRVEEKDPVRAERMREILNQMLEIDRKGEENNRRIKALRDKNKDGDKAGASERYNQAELLSMENEKLVRAWLSLLERFTLIEDESKSDR